MTGYFHRLAARTGLGRAHGDRVAPVGRTVMPLEVEELRTIAAPAPTAAARPPDGPAERPVPPQDKRADTELPSPVARREAAEPARREEVSPMQRVKPALPRSPLPEAPDELIERVAAPPRPAPPAPDRVPAPVERIDPARASVGAATKELSALARVEAVMGDREPRRPAPAPPMPATSDGSIRELSERVMAERRRPMRADSAAPLRPARGTQQPPAAGAGALPPIAPLTVVPARQPPAPPRRPPEQAPAIRIGSVRVDVHGPETAPPPAVAQPLPPPPAPPRPPALRRFYVRI